MCGSENPGCGCSAEAKLSAAVKERGNKMAGNLPPFLAKGKKSGPSADAISRRLKNMQKSKGKKTNKKPPFSKSDPDYAADMAGK